MFKNYLVTTWRSISKYRSYSLINVLGLTLGITSCLIILLVVRYELNYDQFNSKANRTYRVTLNALDFNSNVSFAIVPALRNDFPELEQVTQVYHRGEGTIEIGTNRYIEKGFAFADDHFLRVFDYPLKDGNPGTCLSEPNSIVLTEKLARKYFGEKKALGQTIKLNNEYTMKVTGVMQDPPGNTSLPFLFLVSLNTLKLDNEMMTEFYAIPGGSFAFIVLPEHYSIQQIEKRIPAFIEKNWGKNIVKEARLPLQPLSEIHFDQRYINNIITPTSRATYWSLAIVGIFIIVMASINFINLSTALAIRRAKEVGVRKVLGANRRQLVLQFLGETSVLVLLSLLIGLLVSSLFLPSISGLLDIQIDRSQLEQPAILGMLLLITTLLVFLAGLYPAFVQSSFKPAESLKSKPGSPLHGLSLRKGLVLVQFAISQVLIVGTLVVASQMDYFKNQDLGFNKEAVINFWLPDQSKREVLRQQLLSDPGVKEICFSSGAPSMGANASGFNAPELGMTKIDVTQMIGIDEKYTDMFGLTMLAGQKIEKKSPGDSTNRLVVNETLIHKLGIQDPRQAIGKKINLGLITGVVQDFQNESKHKKRRSCVLYYDPDDFYVTSVRIEPKRMQETIQHIDRIWSGLFTKNIFEFEFLDEHIAMMYRQEQKEYTAFRFFAAIAILIGVLGLYGLVSLAAAQRTKEVGIRKVLGATWSNIVFLFAKEFLLLIFIAFLFAVPIAYYAMRSWLDNFAYRINMSVALFLAAIMVSFAIAGITVLYQSIKASLVNPIKSLRTE
jgi:putative ABC transport system permease protein